MQQNENDNKLHLYLSKGSSISKDLTKYIIISDLEKRHTFYEWFKIETPICLLYDFVRLIDHNIKDFDLHYKINKVDFQKITKDDNLKLRDISHNHTVEIKLTFI